MDYDDNEFHGQNCHIGGEESSKVSPVLHPYALPKFDFDDGLQTHLRFDSLVEKEAFLGIQNQEDNQWIEDFSREPEPCSISRSNNVWSEAASSESVEMLLKSVGQEETVTVVEETDACQRLGSVADEMDSQFQQDKNMMNVTDPALILPSEKVAEHGSVLNDAEGVSNSSRVEISTLEGSHMSRPNALSETCRIHGDEDNLDRRYGEENLTEANTSHMQEPSGSNVHTEIENSTSQEDNIVNTVCLDNKESVTVVTDVGLDIASCLLTDHSVKEVKEQDVLRKEFQVGNESVEGSEFVTVDEKNVSKEVQYDIKKMKSSEFETLNENRKDLPSPVSNSETEELRPVEINVSKLDESSVMTEERDEDVFAAEPNKVGGLLVSYNVTEECDEDVPKDSQVDGNDVIHVGGDGTKKAEISTGSELKLHQTKEIANCLEEGKVLLPGSDCHLVPEVSVSDNQATVMFNLDNKVSDVPGDGTGISFVAEYASVTSTCFPTLVQEGEHSVGGDASSVHHQGSSAKDLVFSPTVSALGSNLNSVHHDEAVSSNGEEKPMFRNDCDIIETHQGEHSSVTSTCFPSLVQEGEHSVGGDALSVHPGLSAEDRVSALDSNLNSVHHDQVVSSDGEEKPMFRNDCEIIQTHDHEKGVEISFNEASSNVNNETVCGSESDTAAKIVPDVTTETPPLLNEGCAGDDLTVDQSKETTGIEKAGSDETKLGPVKETSKSTDQMKSHLKIGKGSAYNPTELSQEAADHALPVVGTSKKANESEQTGVITNVTTNQPSLVAEIISAGLEAEQVEKTNQVNESFSIDLDLSPAMCNPTSKQPSSADASDTPANHRATGTDHRLTSSEVSDSGVPMVTTKVTLRSCNALSESKGEKSLVKSVPPAVRVESVFKDARQSYVDKDGKSFTFEVPLTGGAVGECNRDKQLFPTTQSFKSFKEASFFTPSVGPIEPKTVPEPSRVSSQALNLEIAPGGSTVTPVRKRGRPPGKSTGKQSAKKRNSLKETISSAPLERGDDKSTLSTRLTGTGHLQFEEVKLKHSGMSTYAGSPVVTPNLPDLNTSASPSGLLRQPFTDIQQMQLRSQIFVYGSLMQEVIPDETHMVKAFGTTDGGRKMWEPVWRARVEKLQDVKSNLDKSDNSKQSHSGSNQPEQSSTKKNALQSRAPLPPISLASSMGTPSPVANPMIPLSSPLWNMSTPFRGIQPTGMPRSSIYNYHQTLAPSLSFQTPPSKNVAVNNSSLSSQSSFPAPWITASQSSPFDASARLPRTETAKVIHSKESVPPVTSGAKHSIPSTAVPHSGPSVSVEPYPLPDIKKTTLPAQKKAEPKSRKRKKSSVSENLIQSPLIPQPRTESLPTPPPWLTQARAELMPAPVVPSHLSTSVVSTPHFFGSKENVAKIVTTQKESGVADSAHLFGQARTELMPAPVVPSHLSTSVSSSPHLFGSKENVAKIVTTQKELGVFDSAHLFGQARTELVPALVVPSHLSTSVVSTPQFSVPKGNDARIVTPASLTYSIDQSKRVESNVKQKSNLPEDALINVEVAKQQAENAAALAAAAVGHSQTVWDKLNEKKNFGLTAEVEAKLASAAVAVAAAAAVAKAAAAAAQVASNAAFQAKMMADEAWVSGRVDNLSSNSAPSICSMANSVGLATSPSVSSKVVEGSSSSSILVAAKEAARKRIEAASFASKRAENLDAIIKAAELAASAVSQAGRIVAMGDAPSLAKLVEAGPEGYWKTPEVPPEQVNQEHCNIGIMQEAPNVSDRHANEEQITKKAKTTSRGMSPLSSEVFKDLMEDYMKGVEGMPIFSTTNEKGSRDRRDPRASGLDKTIGVVPESESGSKLISSAAEEDHNKGMEALKGGTSIREGCLVEVKKEGSGFKEAWFSAEVLSMENGKALVSFDGKKSGSTELKEWVALEGDGGNAPRIRIAHVDANKQFQGTKKRRRGAFGDCEWFVGDKVDAWMQECWREGIVTDINRIDSTTLTVHFPAEGETSVVRVWHLRPTLIWKNGAWIENSSSRQRDPLHKGDTPQEKRLRLDGPSTEGSKDTTSKKIQLPGPERPEELQLLPLSDKEKMFNVGNDTKKDNKLDASRIVRSGLQKEGPRVVFGVPKPGKKKKFMEVSKHYVPEKSNKTDTSREKYTMPKNDGKVKQQGELKTKVPKPGKPASSFGRTVPRKDKLPSSKRSASTDGSDSEPQKKSEFRPVSSSRAGQSSFAFSSAAISRNTYTSNSRSERVKKGNRTPLVAQWAKGKLNDNLDAGKQVTEAAEPRRSNRTIQPTSRLLEGIQSSLVLPKFPSFGHDKGQRSHNRSSTPKGAGK